MNFNLVYFLVLNILYLTASKAEPIIIINDMFLFHSWQTRLVRIDSDADLWYSIFCDIVIQRKN